MDRAQIIEIEDAAFRAVPAAEVVELDGWRLRATPGLSTRRVNSVLAAGHPEGQRLDRKLDAVERFHRDRGSPARFQLCPASEPAGLEPALCERGYRIEGETEGQTATLTGGWSPPTEVTIGAEPTDCWWRTWAQALALDDARLPPVAALFGRITTPTAFAVASRDQTPVAVGLGVHDGDWLSIHNMATRSEHRGRGAARAVLASLMGWGRDRGASAAYLQVQTGNAAALALYHRAGFRAAYGYRYLTQAALGTT